MNTFIEKYKVKDLTICDEIIKNIKVRVEQVMMFINI